MPVCDVLADIPYNYTFHPIACTLDPCERCRTGRGGYQFPWPPGSRQTIQVPRQAHIRCDGPMSAEMRRQFASGLALRNFAQPVFVKTFTRRPLWSSRCQRASCVVSFPVLTGSHADPSGEVATAAQALVAGMHGACCWAKCSTGQKCHDCKIQLVLLQGPWKTPSLKGCLRRKERGRREVSPARASVFVFRTVSRWVAGRYPAVQGFGLRCGHSKRVSAS